MNRSISGMIAAIAIVICGILAGASARAQTTVDVFNNSPCSLEVVLFDRSKPVVTNLYFVPPGRSSVTFPPGFVPVGAISAAGTSFPFVNGCTVCIAMHDHVTPTSTCCAAVCYDPNASPNPTITLIPCATCQP